MVAVSSVCLKLDHRDSRIPYCCCCVAGTASLCEDDDESRDAPNTDVVNNNSNAKESEHEHNTEKRAVRDHLGGRIESLMINLRVF